ncbi:MAG TPA: RNA pseudouridine synthase [Flavobacteriales bacterium]|jgi:23S rRNA pseudouridine1911/1915/1917 synthase|nr:RluA family pseudouridine synthase [Flavobacteriales bacterium]HAW20086.1 RNA pseudouridine synthase [Flavobacteriales bacterium]
MRSSIDLKDRILFEDNHLIIVNKLPGELVQGDKTGDHTLADSVKEYIRRESAKPGNVYLGIPHRLDRPVSGLVIYTKTSKALSRMSEIFRSKTISKEYWAVTEKPPKASKGTLTNFLAKNEKQNKSYVVDESQKGAKSSTLHYNVLSKSDRYTLIGVSLETGRHHQIRAQLSNMGSIIKGDLKYGAKRSNPDGSINLHSRSTSFIHPVQQTEINITAPCPNESLWQFFEGSV